MWVLPIYQGKGLGRKLLTVYLDELLNQHPRSLITVISDPNAVPFYEHLGFRKTGSVESYPTGRFLPVLEKRIA